VWENSIDVPRVHFIHSSSRRERNFIAIYITSIIIIIPPVLSLVSFSHLLAYLVVVHV
jgi:hypothetical protein